MSKLIVINWRESKVYADKGWKIVKISRPSVLGNPFKIGVHGNRNEVIKKYKTHLWKMIQLREDGIMDGLWQIVDLLNRYEKVALACYCRPKRCHGDVIISCINYMRENWL